MDSGRQDGSRGVAIYRELIASFLAAHACKQELGGYPAFEGMLVAGQAADADTQETGPPEPTVQAQYMVVVYVSAVLCKWPADINRPGFPALWFVVDGKSKKLNSFAVETELIIEALENADPDVRELRIPIPAFEAHDPDEGAVLAGHLFHMRLKSVRIEAAPHTDEPRLPTRGIRFEIGVELDDDEKPPVHSFTMAGVTPFLALSAPVEHYSGPSSFALEFDELMKTWKPLPNEP